VLLDVTESEMAANATAVGTSGAGLLGMRERVEAHGGELKIDFDPAGGLSLHAWIPVEVQGLEVADA
jgi:signal transduction histidine kinase